MTDEKRKRCDIFMDAMITVIIVIFIEIQTKAFSALPSCVLKMFAANIKEHNASQVYKFTNDEKI